MCVKNSLWDINIFHFDLMVSWAKVKFGEKLETMELIQEVINDRDVKFIFDNNLLKALMYGHVSHVPSFS